MKHADLPVNPRLPSAVDDLRNYLHREQQARQKAEAICDLIGALAASPGREEGMRLLADCARRVSEANFTFMGTLEGDFIRITAQSGDDGGYLKAIAEPGETPVGGSGLLVRALGPMTRALRTSAACVAEDVAVDEAITPNRRAALVERGFRSVVAVPITYQSQVLGAIGAYGPEPNFFGQEQVGMLMRTAELAAPVIDSLRRQRQERDRHLETILMLAKACEARDETTGQHLQRIHQLSRQLGLQMGLSVEEADRIATAAILHDIGKIRLPESILQNPGRLSDQEWEEMRKHPIYGEEILGDSLDFTLERQCVRWHHERWDGSGYPDGLLGEAIPLPARIVAVADAFDAMTSERPYKAAWPPERAVAEILNLRDKHYDPRVVDALLALWKSGRVGPTWRKEGEVTHGPN